MTDRIQSRLENYVQSRPEAVELDYLQLGEHVHTDV
jgi:hypothetical protein